MCENCKPKSEVVDTVDPIEQITPFEYHDDVKTYVTGGDTIHENTLLKIRKCLGHWRILAGQKCPELPPLETLERFAEVWESGLSYDATWHVSCCLIPGYQTETFYGSNQPSMLPVAGDTDEKRKANRKALAKKWHRFISDCYGSECIGGVQINLNKVTETVLSLGNKVKVNGQSLAKRIGKALHAIGWKLTKQQIETLNNLADSGITPQETHNVAFDNDYLDASPSQYGNGRSCWWQDGDYGHARHTFHADGGYACRTFTDSGSVSGRVWIVPTPQGHLLFNAYLKPLSTFALMLSSAWECDLLEVAINHEHSFYINNGSGYLIGDKAKFPADGCVRYRPEFVENEDIGGICCYHCSDHIDEDESWSDPNDNCLCQSCFNARWGYCGRCEDVYDNDEIYECGCNHYCESCAERNGYRECADCDTWADDLTELNNGNCVCDSCLESYTCCEGCSEYFDSSECETCEANNCEYCSDCMPESEPETGEQYCQATGEVIDTDDIGSDWPAHPTGTLSSRSHCPVIPLFSSELPVSANAISQMMDRVADGRDISAFPAAVTAMSLCLAGF